MQVGDIDRVRIEQTKMSNSGSCKIESKWATDSATTNEGYFGVDDIELTLVTDLLEEHLAGISFDEFACELGFHVMGEFGWGGGLVL